MYIRNLLKALQLEDTENSYNLLMARNDSDLVPLNNPNFSKRLYAPQINHPIMNLIWQNIRLPQKKFDLLHIPSYRRIPLLKRTRVVATIHDLAPFSVDEKYDRTRMFFNHKIVPTMIRNADHVIAVSHNTRDDLVQHIGYPEEKISVIYSGIDHGLFVPVHEDEARYQLDDLHELKKPFFIYVSRLEYPSKNHVRLIDAFERFKKANDSDHQLVLAGADWHGAKHIRARVALSPVKDDIILPGFVPHESLPLLYSACDLMIYPSLFEGFGFPVLEALACGAHVICSNTSSLKEIAAPSMNTFNPEISEEIYQCMETVLLKGSSEDITQGIQHAKTFDWSKTARDVISLYEKVV